MRKIAQINRLPSPVVAVIRDEDGTIIYSFAPTLYRAQAEARRAGATDISLSPWQHFSPHGAAPVV